MKKSLFVISSIIIAFALVFTACGKKETTFVDQLGTTHIAYTHKDGSTKQDKLGNVYEVVTDLDGSTRTKIMKFPDVVTNKSNSIIENSALKIKVPKGWKTSGHKNKIILQHSGECSDMGSHCEIYFRSDVMQLLSDKYAAYLNNVKYLIDFSSECSDLKEYETKMFDTTVKAVSYKMDNTDTYCYCYFIQKEAPVIEIEAYAYEKCYSEEELIALLEKYVTIKDLGGEAPTTTASTTTAAAENTSATASSAK